MTGSTSRGNGSGEYLNYPKSHLPWEVKIKQTKILKLWYIYINIFKFKCLSCLNFQTYSQTSNIISTLVRNKIVDHSTVVTSAFSTKHLAPTQCTEATAWRDEKHLSFGIWCVLYKGFDYISFIRVRLFLTLDTDMDIWFDSRTKMAAILETTFPNIFSSMKAYQFRYKCHKRLFQKSN